MATQTTLKAPVPVLHTSVTPIASTSKLPFSCTHLSAFLSASNDLSAFERLQLAVRYACKLEGSTGGKTAPPAPACSTCSTTPLRPFLCLECGTASCGGMGRTSHGHGRAKKELHNLAFDLRSKALYCFGCQDYVQSAAVDRLITAEQLLQAEKTQEKVEGRVLKRKRVSMSQREFSATVPPSVVVAARGIRNLGNSCYLSVVLQTFFVNPFLRSHYLADRHNRKACPKSRVNEPCLSCEMDSLFAEQYGSDSTPLAPTRLLHSFWQSSAEAAGYAQQDAHEFLISTINLIHSSSPSHTDNPAFPCPCIVHRTFSGQLRSAVKCQRCGHQSETLEPFLDLNLDVRNRGTGRMAETVGRCLDSFTSPEELPSKYDCAACGPGVPSSSKRLSIKTLPQVLCIQLKRFEHNSTATKIDAQVRYPLKLDMSPYLSANLDYPASAKTNPANATSEYHLSAIVAHEGTLSQGHYTAFVRGADDYFALDDEKVRRVRISEVLAAKAYLLVYSRA